jgi:hypothetical protein
MSEGAAMERAAQQMRQVAMVLANAAAANAEVESMKSANRVCRDQGITETYGEAAFSSVIERWALHPNAVITTLNQ